MDVIPLSVHPPFLKAVGHELLARAMAFKTDIYALLHFVRHSLERISELLIKCFESRL